MVSVISVSHRNSFPVADERGILVGIVELDTRTVTSCSAPSSMERCKVRKIMVTRGQGLLSHPDDGGHAPLRRDEGVEDARRRGEGRYLGFISKSAIFNSYREVLNCTFIGDPLSPPHIPVCISLTVYEDNFLCVSKRPGEIVQGDKTGDEPMSEALKGWAQEKYNKPGNVYRRDPSLDRPCGWTRLFAKTSRRSAV